MTFQIIEEAAGRAMIIVTTKSGKRYMSEWAHVPTLEEVKEQWRISRRWFIHIN